MTVKRNRLKPSEYNRVLDKLKHTQQWIKDNIALLIQDRNWYAFEYKKLSEQVEQIRNPGMFKKEEIKESPKPVYMTKHEMAYAMLKTRNMEVVSRFLKNNGMTLKQAEEMAAQWAVEKGLPMAEEAHG